MSDICESCGCPEGVDGHDVLYRQINELKDTVNKNNGINNLARAIGTMDAEERKLLTDEIHRLDRLIDSYQKFVEMTWGLHQSRIVDVYPGEPDEEPMAEDWRNTLKRLRSEMMETEKRKGPIMHVPGCAGGECSCKPVFGGRE